MCKGRNPLGEDIPKLVRQSQLVNSQRLCPSSYTPSRMSGSGTPNESQGEEHLRLQVSQEELIRTS